MQQRVFEGRGRRFPPWPPCLMITRQQRGPNGPFSVGALETGCAGAWLAQSFFTFLPFYSRLVNIRFIMRPPGRVRGPRGGVRRLGVQPNRGPRILGIMHGPLFFFFPSCKHLLKVPSFSEIAAYRVQRACTPAGTLSAQNMACDETKPCVCIAM